MALIGEMQYLKIGGNTYSIPVSGGSTVTIERALTSGTKSATISVDGTSYDLYAPTPNAGTVTSVRVQATSPVQSSTSTAQSSTLNTTISLANGYGDTKNPYASKTKNYVLAAPATENGVPSFRALVAADIPDLSGTYLTSYTETDPVFSASAAAGITATDISNWNAKSDTDEKVKTEVAPNEVIYIVGSNSSNTTTGSLKKVTGITIYSSSDTWTNGTGRIVLGNSTDVNTAGGKSGQIQIYGNGQYYVSLQGPATTPGITANRTLTLPNKDGTIALTSDIPDISGIISDDKTWNGVVLNKSITLSGQDLFFPSINNASAGTESYFVRGTSTPTQYALAKYDANAYLYSTTPSASDNSTKVATTAYIDSAIDALPEPMVFKGSVGTGGTITTLPTAAASNKGHTYKVITALSSPSAKVGDIVISNGSEWIVIPSGGSVSFVTFSHDESTDTYSADKTAMQLYQDVLDGKIVLGRTTYDDDGNTDGYYFQLDELYVTVLDGAVRPSFTFSHTNFAENTDYTVSAFCEVYMIASEGATDVVNGYFHSAELARTNVSINGYCLDDGIIRLTAEDVGALSSSTVIPTYTAGTGIDITNGVISIDLDNAEGGTY